MLIRAAAALPVVDVADEKIAHGALLRFLGETVWFPSAALSPYVEWEALDGASARATVRHAGITASATFVFDAEGRVARLSAERYLGGGAHATLTPWVVSCSDWRRFDGFEIPVRGDVRWQLPAGDFSYYQWEITTIDFDLPKLYEVGATTDAAPPAAAAVAARRFAG